MRVSKSSIIFFSAAFLIAFCVILGPSTDIQYSPAAIQAAPDALSPASLTLSAKGHIPMPSTAPAAHASSLVSLSERHAGELAAFWFAGTRESAPDVQIAFSFFDRKTEKWSPASFAVNRHVLAQQIGYGVRRLGNPVAWLDASDRLHLFVVATGLGGWAAARIVHLVQEGDPYDLNELRFGSKGAIPLSWLWNTSHLVRNFPMPLSTGGMALPIHFEIGVKYPALAWFSEDGHFMGMRRISSRGNLLQPTVVAKSEKHWLSFMRAKGGNRKIATAESLDAGKTWHDFPDLDHANPDAAVAAMRIGQKNFVMAKNPSTSSRHDLTLLQSLDGRKWSSPIVVEQGSPGEEYSYPSLEWVNDSLWVSYTNQRKRISWQRFSLPSQSVNNDSPLKP
jgi:predicted neuraminidase